MSTIRPDIIDYGQPYPPPPDDDSKVSKTTTDVEKTELSSSSTSNEEVSSKVNSFAKGLFNILKSEKKGAAVLALGTALLGVGSVVVFAGIATASAPLWVAGAATLSVLALPIIVSTGIYYFARDKMDLPKISEPLPPLNLPTPTPGDDDDLDEDTLNTPPIIDGKPIIDENPVTDENKLNPEEMDISGKKTNIKHPISEEEEPSFRIYQNELEEEPRIYNRTSDIIKEDMERNNLFNDLENSVEKVKNSFPILENTLESLGKEDDLPIGQSSDSDEEINLKKEENKESINPSKKEKSKTNIKFFDPLGDLYTYQPKSRRAAPIRDVNKKPKIE